MRLPPPHPPFLVLTCKVFRLFVKYLIFFKKKVSIMSCGLCARRFCWPAPVPSLLSADLARSSELLAVFSWLTHLISLYENSAHQEISPNVNNKYLWSRYFLKFFIVFNSGFLWKRAAVSATSVISAVHKQRRLGKKEPYRSSKLPTLSWTLSERWGEELSSWKENKAI